MVNANDTLGSRPDGSNFHLIHPRVGHDRIPRMPSVPTAGSML